MIVCVVAEGLTSYLEEQVIVLELPTVVEPSIGYVPPVGFGGVLQSPNNTVQKAMEYSKLFWMTKYIECYVFHSGFNTVH